MTRTALYRFYDASDVLLYIGITGDVETRWNNHARKRWWPEVARKAVEWHEERDAAEVCEKAAIKAEKPLYNIAHVPERRVRREVGPPPAARFHARVLTELASKGRSKLWLHQQSGVARNTIDNWATQPRSPQAASIMAVADALDIPREEAAALSGLVGGIWDAAAESIDLTGFSDIEVLMELAKRVLNLTDELEIGYAFLNHAREKQQRAV